MCRFLVVLVLGLSGCHRPAEIVSGLTILKIDDFSVSTEEFAQQLARRLRNYDSLTVKDPVILKRAKEDTLQSFVIEAVTRKFAVANGIRVSSEEVAAEVASRKKIFPDEFAFRRGLADENISLDSWTKMIEMSLLQQRVYAKITKDIRSPTDEEVKKYYDSRPEEFARPARVKLRQVVVEKEDDAKRILEQLGRGGKMADLAKKFSVAPESAKDGETDWIEKGVLDVFDESFKMPVGTRSKIMRSPYGWHIYDVIKKEPESRLSFNDAKAKIRSRLSEQRQQAAFSGWLEEQVRKSRVFRNDSLLQSINVSTKPGNT